MDKRQECFFMIKQLHDGLEKHINNQLKKYDLTMTQMGALMMLHFEKQDCCTLKEFEKILHLAQSTTVGIVKRLEQKGLVETKIDAADRRNKNINITNGGLQLCKQTCEHMDQTTKLLLEDFTDEELDIFNHVMRRICEKV